MILSNIENFDSNNIKIDEKSYKDNISYKDILIYWICDDKRFEIQKNL